MRITDYNEANFEIIPDGATESNILKRFPAFLRVKGHFVFPKRPAIVQDIIGRLKKVYKKPIDANKRLVDILRAKEELKEIPEDFPWLNTPYPHQELALRYLYTHGSAGLLLEPGLGKTFVVLNYIKLMGFRKSLVVCPKALLFVWEDEVKEHRPDKKVYVLKSTSWKDRLLGAETRATKWAAELDKHEEGTAGYKRAKSNLSSARRDIKRIPEEHAKELEEIENADIIVCNYEKVAPGYEQLAAIGFDFIAIDEGLIKDTTTSRTKAITKLSQKIDYRVIMSGTLINKGALDIFAPVRFIEPSLVSTAYGRFEEFYAHKAKLKNGRSFVTGVAKHKISEIRDTLAACSIVMTKDEWLDLPDKHFHPIYVDQTPSQQRVTEELSSNLICKIDEDRYLEVDNALTLSGKLMQVSNGFAYRYESDGDIDDLWGMPTEKPDKGKRETIWLDSYKEREFRNLLENQCAGRKTIVWYNLSAEYEQISETLDKMGIEYMSIKGGSKDTGGTVRSFNKSGTCQVLVCQSQAVNYGITVLGEDPENLDKDVEILPDFDTRCHTQIFWSMSWSLERFLQQQDRIHRIGQEEDCDYYILITKDSIEEFVWSRIGDRKAINEQILVDYINRSK